MSTSSGRIKAGERCLVVGEVAGCECNIGAMVIVCVYDAVDKSWTFRDASRLIKCEDDFGFGLRTAMVTNSDENVDPRYEWVLMDKHLVPIRDTDKESEDEHDQVTDGHHN